MSEDKIAFFIGLFGSVHCIGMCGPLAFAIPVAQGRGWLLLGDKLIYNLGRTFSYCLLGLLTGLIGQQLWLAGLQQWVSLFSGIFIIMAAFVRLLKLSVSRSAAVKNHMGWFNRLLSHALKHQWGHLFIGVLNGFLPCGFVYLALAGAVNTGNVISAVQYMFWFGMGTVPLMLLATISSSLISIPLRRQVNKVIPYIMLVLGVWFLLRGLNLNIPYLSPPKTVTETSMCG
ncbi:sulfite exporter TauE/SafE family protein [Mucilaginibacter sp. PAMB04168]|uniref:sulfite exporter TauE/SafE family protein n=1 Tax=Mucilaginibacter sp. PAMB04168 TaxID=3138567 RepID=UPI0031F64600